ncbi:hypothetical protein [Catellatospora sp. NPDC049609]|uniref:hypothetical protein n=1 Tax=Catellatospora sp. NPDC049609 TaxID=3155505 RepID=UPI0034484F25
MNTTHDPLVPVPLGTGRILAVEVSPGPAPVAAGTGMPARPIRMVSALNPGWLLQTRRIIAGGPEVLTRSVGYDDLDQARADFAAIVATSGARYATGRNRLVIVPVQATPGGAR